jgi:protein SCO1/2
MRNLRLVLWVLVAIAVGVLAVLMLAPVRQAPPQSGAITADTFGGPFNLTGADGQPFSSARLAGRPHAIFFGFTHCPDVCPTTLARLVKLRGQVGGERPFEILFITVDPQRDGPAEVGKYTELFDSPVIGLTGSPAEIAQVKKQFGIFSRKVPDSSGGYGVDHTSTVLLFDGKGDFVSTISPEEPDSAALAKLKRISA